MVTKKKTRSKIYRSFIGILLGICLITIPAVTALAKRRGYGQAGSTDKSGDSGRNGEARGFDEERRNRNVD